MATNPRQVEREMAQAGQEATRKVAEQTTQAARAVADAGERTARVGTEMMERNSESVRQAWQSGTETASRLVERSMDQLARAFGLSGENAEHTARQSTRPMEALLQSSTILAGGAQTVSRELFTLTQKRMEQQVERFDALMNCRTIQDLMAAQTDLVRDDLEDFLHSARRIAQISTQVADEAVRKVTDTSLAPR